MNRIENLIGAHREKKALFLVPLLLLPLLLSLLVNPGMGLIRHFRHDEQGLAPSIRASDHNLGHLEERLFQETRPLQRQVLEEAAQKKADGTPARCPYCGNLLRRLSAGHWRTFESRFGSITVRRQRGWCKHCHRWRFPADSVLGLEETGSCTPSVQDLVALGVSKMPVEQAGAVIERMAGVNVSAHENGPACAHEK